MIQVYLAGGVKVQVFMDSIDEFVKAFESDSKSIIVTPTNGGAAILLPKRHIIVAQVVESE